ncbi:DUF1365 domain-containing protein [Streptomyces sp. ME02-8801-2C]|uniref:DUF1365 domain-containing protein n=1 Tax=Streptomyces sp. ME02-8801-2C TaxID=3028680 RepID=UPI0029BCFCAF|nr:DUF1365 domain-containing protein [Streptomyces sp. ME02-8801-2C]MDX3457307.1 DUF1365 domain-containing protein [Streptomyces sp. ME02-8801-2C]
MSAALYTGRLTHTRRTPLRRVFHHRLYLWLVDLDDLPVHPWWLRPFTRILASDHRGEPDRPLRPQIDAWLRDQGVDHTGGRVLMLTNARVFGHVFNPLTVYWCLTPAGDPAWVIAEVHNTYGQHHRYLLKPAPDGHARTAKTFYVSPFLDVAGEYRMRLPVPGERLSLAVSLVQDGRTVFSASLTGRHRGTGPADVLRTVVAHPLLPQRITLAIRLHGIVLWLRRLPIFPRRPAVRTPR